MGILQYLFGEGNSEKTNNVSVVQPLPEPEAEKTEDSTLDPKSVKEKDVEDALSAKALFSVVTLIDERRRMLSLITDLKSQIVDSKVANNTHMQEKKDLFAAIEKRDQKLASLGSSYSEQQRQFEELSEKFKQAKIEHNEERERLLQQSREWQLNFETVDADLRILRSDAAQEQFRLQDMLREEKAQHNHTQAQYQKVLEDNKNLVKQITAFTNQFVILNPLKSESKPVQEENKLNIG